MTSPADPVPGSAERALGESTELWRIEASRTGEPTAYVGERALHSRFNPRKEAIRAAESIPEGIAVVVLGGLGLGYVAEAILEKGGESLLVIAEADPGLPARAREVRNLETLLRHPRVRLLAGGPAKDVQEFLRGGAVGSGIHYLGWKPSTSLHPDWYEELSAVIAEAARRREVNARTLERFGPVWVRNLASNSALLPEALSLYPWKDAFKDIPALVLAGGPSLEKLLPLLPALAGSHLIIAVDTALRAVLGSGAVPDIIAAVDPQYWNTRHLDRCGELSGEALILAESATHPAVFRCLEGRPWLIRTRFPLGSILEDAAGLQGELKAGGSVATAAWDLARHLGCSPMSIAGLDLGFPGGQTHYSGSLSRTLPLISSGRTCPAENAFYHALHDAGSRAVPATGGGSILSDARMDIYAAWFAESAGNLQNRNPALVGEGGRAIEGMKTVSVDQLMKQPDIRKHIDGILSDIRHSSPSSENGLRISEVLKTVGEALSLLESEAEKGFKQAEKAEKALREGKSASRFLNAMEDTDRRILGGEGLEIVSFLIQPIILEITSGTGNDDPLKTSARLYREIADSAAFHRKYLQRARIS